MSFRARTSTTLAACAVLTTGLLAPASFASPPLDVEPSGATPSAGTSPTAPAATPEVRAIDIPAAATSSSRAPVVVADTGRRAVDDFAMVGVTWAAGPEHPDLDVQVRVRSDSAWTEWQHLEAHEGDGTRTSTDPLWVRDADGVQARVVSSDPAPADLEVALVDPTLPTATSTTSTTTSTGTVAQPPVVTRAAWGADESLTSTCDAGTYGSTVRAAFVHHTVHTVDGSNDYTAEESPSIVNAIYAYQTQTESYCDIAYNFLVDRFGTVFEGRRGGPELPVIGGHTFSFNTDSFGVSLIGDFEEAEPPAEMIDSTARLIAWKLALNYRDPQGTTTLNEKTFEVISGHRDASNTLCPGQHVYDLLPTLRQTVDNLVAPYDSPIYTKWQQLGGETGFAGSPFRGETASGDATYAEFGGADIWWTSGTGAHEVHGKIRDEYRRFTAGDDRLGVPTTDQQTGSRKGSRYNVFEGGRIYWSKDTGARTLYGPVLRRYLGLDAEGSRLRLPTTGIKAGYRAGSSYTIFQGGRIYWSEDSGARQVWGPILRRYLKVGAAKSRLRLPTTAEYAVRGGTVQKFQGGRIRWYRSTGSTKVIYN